MSEDEIDLHYDEFLKTLGQRIKKFRKERGLSLHDMVVKHGYHDSQWRRFERGGAANMLSLLKIARAFNTSLSDLLDGLGEFPAKSVPEIKRELSSAKRAASKAVKSA